MLDWKRLRQYGPASLVLVVGCAASIGGFLVERRIVSDKTAEHASAHAIEYQNTLQRGINSYLHLGHEVAALLTANPKLDQRAFASYMRIAGAMREHPGLSYVGYLQRVAAPAPPPAGAANTRAAGSAELYPYLYVYPDTSSAIRARGLDFSAIPERWSAMQQARDTGAPAVSARHFYRTDPRRTPIVVVFTPVYDPALPAATVAERRQALRGFVFAIIGIDEAIERVMGPAFHARFDLEIYDGRPRPEALLYDGDSHMHALAPDPEFSLARAAPVAIADRTWDMFFFTRPQYRQRQRDWRGLPMLLLGMTASGALSMVTALWLKRDRRRVRRVAEQRHFEEVFERHPSAVFLLDRHRRIINANGQAAREFKFSKDVLIGMSPAELVVPENRERTRAAFEAALAGESVSYESAFTDGAGERVEVGVIMVPMLADGEVASVLGIAQNITEKKLSEWRTMESKAMLGLVINHIPQRVFWKDTQLAFIGCNEAFARDAGLERPEDIIGKTDFDLAWHANAEAYRKDDIETMSSGRAKINYEEPQMRSDGSESWLRTSKIPLSGMDGRIVGLLGVYEDITEHKMMERQLREMAHYDSLTGLANRAFFYHQLELAVLRARRRPALAALVYLDLDRFKAINDNHGHDVGDAVLKAFAQRIRSTVRAADMAARLGGDEFAVLLEDLPDHGAAAIIARKLVAAMQAPIIANGIELPAGTSVGVAFFEPGLDAEEVVRRADRAMYRAKRAGRNRYEVDDRPAE